MLEFIVERWNIYQWYANDRTLGKCMDAINHFWLEHWQTQSGKVALIPLDVNGPVRVLDAGANHVLGHAHYNQTIAWLYVGQYSPAWCIISTRLRNAETIVPKTLWGVYELSPDLSAGTDRPIDSLGTSEFAVLSNKSIRVFDPTGGKETNWVYDIQKGDGPVLDICEAVTPSQPFGSVVGKLTLEDKQIRGYIEHVNVVNAENGVLRERFIGRRIQK